jgi:hypothetical protein
MLSQVAKLRGISDCAGSIDRSMIGATRHGDAGTGLIEGEELQAPMQ